MFRLVSAPPQACFLMLFFIAFVLLTTTEARSHLVNHFTERFPEIRDDDEDKEAKEEAEEERVSKRQYWMDAEDYGVEGDRPRKMCGQALIRNLKQQCGQRGTYSPYQKRNAHRLTRLPNAFISDSSSTGSDQEEHITVWKRYDDICKVYLQYEPDSPLAQCCCLGCTRAYLENFCAEK